MIKKKRLPPTAVERINSKDLTVIWSIPPFKSETGITYLKHVHNVPVSQRRRSFSLIAEQILTYREQKKIASKQVKKKKHINELQYAGKFIDKLLGRMK